MRTFSAPVRASIDVTYACDLRCIHCRTNTGEIPLHIRRKMLTERQLATVIRDLDAMGTFEITLTGGEPTIRRSFWNLIDLVEDLDHASITLITNAARLSAQQLDRIVDSGISSIRISVDGTRETFEAVRLADFFDDVLRNASYLDARVESLKVLTTVMRTNIHNVFDLVEELKIAGIRRHDLILVRAHGRGMRNQLLLTEKEITQLASAVRRFRTQVDPLEYQLNLNAPYLFEDGTGRHEDVVMYPYTVRDSSLAVSATGDVTMSRLYSSKPLGNVKDRPMHQIWHEAQEAMHEEVREHTPQELREIFWNFDETATGYTALLDRQIFEGADVR